MQTMTLGAELIQGLAEGRLHGAIWHGRHELETGPIQLRSPDGAAAVEMKATEIRHKPFIEVNDREASDSGEPDREALWRVMRRAYPDITQADDVTVALLE